MNKKIIKLLKAEQENIEEIKETRNMIDKLEDELEWYMWNAEDEQDHIIHLENTLDKLYRQLELLEKL